MASCRSFITALMKFDHSGLLISKGSCFFKCFPLGLSLLATQLRNAAGGPNPVLLTTKLHVCNKRRVSYGQEKEWISIRISSFYWLCLQEMQCSPCILLAANASVNPDIRTQTSPYLPAHSLKASKKLTERCSYFSPPPPQAQDSPPEGTANLLCWWSPACDVQEGAVQWAFYRNSGTSKHLSNILTVTLQSTCF